MRTTLNIDDDLLREALACSGARTKTEAVALGLRALIQLTAARDLAAMAGADADVSAPRRRRASSR